MDGKNEYILKCIKRFIEDAMENEIEEDERVNGKIIKLLAELHSELKDNN